MNRCASCRALCCRFLILPASMGLRRAREGIIPFAAFHSPVSPDLRYYFALRLGIAFHRRGFVILPDTPAFASESPQLGKRWVVAAPCSQVGRDWTCRIYDRRPVTCRNFTAEYKRWYVVPQGCRFDTEDTGLDVRRVVAASTALLDRHRGKRA